MHDRGEILARSADVQVEYIRITPKRPTIKFYTALVRDTDQKLGVVYARNVTIGKKRIPSWFYALNDGEEFPRGGYGLRTMALAMQDFERLINPPSLPEEEAVSLWDVFKNPPLTTPSNFSPSLTGPSLASGGALAQDRAQREVLKAAFRWEEFGRPKDLIELRDAVSEAKRIGVMP